MARKTPRGVGFCWHCSKKLYGNHHALDKTPDGREIVVHKECKKDKGKITWHDHEDFWPTRKE